MIWSQCHACGWYFASQRPLPGTLPLIEGCLVPCLSLTADWYPASKWRLPGTLLLNDRCLVPCFSTTATWYPASQWPCLLLCLRLTVAWYLTFNDRCLVPCLNILVMKHRNWEILNRAVLYRLYAIGPRQNGPTRRKLTV